MRLRHLFSGVEHFVLYDCFTSSGYVNEDVFAYSNQCGGEKALVIYNNRYERAEGWIKTSVAMNLEIDGGRRLVQKDLCAGLNLRRDDNCFYILKDAVHGLEYLRSARQLSEAGLKVALDGFQLHVFLGFDELCDYDGSLFELERRLAGGGVADVRLAYQELKLADIVLPLKAALAAAIGCEGQVEALARLLTAAAARLQVAVPEPLGLLARLEVLSAAEMEDWLADSLPQLQQGHDAAWRLLASYAVLRELDVLLKAASSSALDVFDEWLVGHCLKQVWQAWGLSGAQAEYELSLIRILLKPRAAKALPACLLDLLDEREIEAYCGFNLYEGVWWFNREAMRSLIANYCLSRLLEGERGFLRLAPRLFECIEASAYRLEELRSALKALKWN
ncbi:MAG: hypothetical protein BWY87_00695 [Deltaproteobacteria bacterium ADurb.Bin510]|nr:MAG: hypothetical protein BWY87_00695 [Deltaproteobacteria bacterium ADurb.Bin510]